MPDYQKMYQTIINATEDAIRILIAAQQKAEDIYLAEPDGNVRPFPPSIVEPIVETYSEEDVTG